MHPCESKSDFCKRNHIVFEIKHEEIIFSQPQKLSNLENNLENKLKQPYKNNINKLYNWNILSHPQNDETYCCMYPTPSSSPQLSSSSPQLSSSPPLSSSSPPLSSPPLSSSSPPLSSSSPQQNDESYDLCMYTPQMNIKTKICLSFNIGQPCKYGINCKFAHTLEELSPIECSFKDNCKNVNCTYIHQGESKSDFCKRNSIIFDNDWNLVKPKVVKSSKKTRMCSSLQLGQPCKHNICNFAHTLEELSPIECSFKDNCKKNLCKFFHPSENKSDYCKRIIVN